MLFGVCCVLVDVISRLLFVACCLSFAGCPVVCFVLSGVCCWFVCYASVVFVFW